jgi:probable HAF family extracellular repeat protein
MGIFTARVASDTGIELSILMKNILALLTFPLLLSASTLYSVTDLGSLGGPASQAYRINNGGQVTGWAQTSDLGTHAFLSGNNGIQMLAAPAGSVTEMGNGVNNTGQVVGTSYLTDGARATIWGGGSATTLGVESYGMAISDVGHVVGSAAFANGQNHAFLYANGAMRDLGTLPGHVWSSAYDLNEAGQVTGTSATGGGTFHAFLWDAQTGMRDLGTLGGRSSYGMAINSSGQVAGHASLASGALHAFLYTSGRMRDLGTLGGSSSYAYDVNSAGDVVGYSWTASGAMDAFLYQNGLMLDLNSLLLGGAGWHVTAAYGINDAGQIVGTAEQGGISHAVRLDPHTYVASIGRDFAVAAPEPSTFGLLLAGGLLGLLWLRNGKIGSYGKARSFPHAD